MEAVCGRFKRIALQQQKTRVKHPPDEITSIITGCEIERLLPSEIALLADPDEARSRNFADPHAINLIAFGQSVQSDCIHARISRHVRNDHLIPNVKAL